MRIPVQRFIHAQSGVASVEFALLGTVLLLIFAGGFDLVYMASAKRDADRASMLIAHAMATCPNLTCMSTMVNTYVPRQANALVRYPTAAIKFYTVQDQSNTIKSCSGSETAQISDSALIASAQNIMRNNDVGSAVMLTTIYTSIVPKAVMSYISSTGATFVGRTVDVMGNVGPAC